MNEGTSALIGDTNGDGSIDALDYALIRKYLLDPDMVISDPRSFDLNQDGQIDSLDLAKLKKYLLDN